MSDAAPSPCAHDDILAFAAALSGPGALIGLDLGEKRIGVAISDARRAVATPLETIKRAKFGAAAARLAEIAAHRGVVGAVVGLPVNMDGSSGPAAQSARAFARNLSRALASPVGLWDERLSTAAVERALIEADASRKRRGEVVDKMAAAFILQGALDRMARAAGEGER